VARLCIEQIRAVVEGNIVFGKNGSYIVTRPIDRDDLGSITFSMSVWSEETQPESGHVVILEALTKKRGGWRAGQARFLRLEDERPAISKGA